MLRELEEVSYLLEKDGPDLGGCREEEFPALIDVVDATLGERSMKVRFAPLPDGQRNRISRVLQVS